MRPRAANRTVLRLRPYSLRVPTGQFSPNPYRKGRLKSARRYGTGKNTGIRPYLRQSWCSVQKWE